MSFFRLAALRAEILLEKDERDSEELQHLSEVYRLHPHTQDLTVHVQCLHCIEHTSGVDCTEWTVSSVH